MSHQTEKIRRVFQETLKDGIIIDESSSIRSVIEECEHNGKLFSYKDMFISPTKTKIDGEESIRIVFAIKEDGGKISNIGKIMELIRDLEKVMISLDGCKQSKVDNFIYLDIYKKLKTVD